MSWPLRCSCSYAGWPRVSRLPGARSKRATIGRPRVLAALTAGLDDRRAILLTDLNWQVQNGLSYFAKVQAAGDRVRRGCPTSLLYAPALVADNRAIGREVALTERARATAEAAYGPLLPIARDRARRGAAARPTRRARSPPGTRYVLCVLRPSRDLRLDAAELAARAARRSTGGRAIQLAAGRLRGGRRRRRRPRRCS